MTIKQKRAIYYSVREITREKVRMLIAFLHDKGIVIDFKKYTDSALRKCLSIIDEKHLARNFIALAYEARYRYSLKSFRNIIDLQDEL